MQIWHLTADASRAPERVVPGDCVLIRIGTWPIEPGQSVSVSYRVEPAGSVVSADSRVDAIWRENAEPNSYWEAELGPFAKRDRVTYTVQEESRDGAVRGPTYSFRAAPRLYVSLLWQQHQPVYKDATHAQAGSYKLTNHASDLKTHAGHTVNIIGDVKADTIEVSKVEMPKS